MKIVALDGSALNPGDNSWAPVQNLGEFEVFDRTAPDEVLERSRDADIVVTNKVVLDRAVISGLPNLKFITVTATGVNVVDVEYARERNIPVSNVPVYGTQSVAQHVFASLLSFLHRPESHHQAIQNGHWVQSKDFSFWLNPLTELAGKTMGIVGLGRIGRATARLADAFGMKIVASSRRQQDPLKTAGFQWLGMNELFGAADVISLHCPQTQTNAGFVNAELISRMKPSAILINTARGGLINEQDLADALNSNRIGGACLDVVSAEPISTSNPLFMAANCLLTPHNAWATIEARKRLMQSTADNVAAFIAGQPINLVN